MRLIFPQVDSAMQVKSAIQYANNWMTDLPNRIEWVNQQWVNEWMSEWVSGEFEQQKEVNRDLLLWHYFAPLLVP
jgi:hypothetical protein